MKFNREDILPLIDLTSLNATDDASTIQLLCEKAISPQGHVAAVCVYPEFVKQAVNFFRGRPVNVATVANFPSGNEPLEVVMPSILDSIKEGAQEIDVVFPYTQYLSGDKVGAHKFILACREACGMKALLKVIIETGALKDLALITEISRNVLLAGADFVKTSTGKIEKGATIEAARAILNVIKEFNASGVPRLIGFKASGGVRTIPQALEYMELAAEILGPEWVNPMHFRIGASQLVDTLIVH